MPAYETIFEEKTTDNLTPCAGYHLKKIRVKNCQTPFRLSINGHSLPRDSIADGPDQVLELAPHVKHFLEWPCSEDVALTDTEEASFHCLIKSINDKKTSDEISEYTKYTLPCRYIDDMLLRGHYAWLYKYDKEFTYLVESYDPIVDPDMKTIVIEFATLESTVGRGAIFKHGKNEYLTVKMKLPPHLSERDMLFKILSVLSTGDLERIVSLQIYGQTKSASAHGDSYFFNQDKVRLANEVFQNDLKKAGCGRDIHEYVKQQSVQRKMDLDMVEADQEDQYISVSTDQRRGMIFGPPLCKSVFTKWWMKQPQRKNVTTSLLDE